VTRVGRVKASPGGGSMDDDQVLARINELAASTVEGYVN
jgi:hypothetical protein